MNQQKIPATPAERQALARRITEAKQAEAVSEHATAVATDVFTMFCDGHGIPGATYVGIEDDTVVVTVPESKPELVPEAKEA